jgi:hypothetical protein
MVAKKVDKSELELIVKSLNQPHARQ